jgi:F5/8 type C domain
MSEEGALPAPQALPHTEGPERGGEAVATGNGTVATAGSAVKTADEPKTVDAPGAANEPNTNTRWARFSRRWARLGRRLRVASFAMLAATAVALVAGEVGLKPDRFHAGATWRASSGGWNFPSHGNGSAVLGSAIFFHTNSEKNPWIEVDLGQTVPITTVEVTNRLDCCSTRALPLVIEVATEPNVWTEMARRRRNFIVWKATFDERPARYVRVRVDGSSMLHLTDLVIR